MGGTDYITNPYFYIGYVPSKEKELSENSSDGWVSGCNY